MSSIYIFLLFVSFYFFCSAIVVCVILLLLLLLEHAAFALFCPAEQLVGLKTVDVEKKTLGDGGWRTIGVWKVGEKKNQRERERGEGTGMKELNIHSIKTTLNSIWWKIFFVVVLWWRSQPYTIWPIHKQISRCWRFFLLLLFEHFGKNVSHSEFHEILRLMNVIHSYEKPCGKAFPFYSTTKKRIFAEWCIPFIHKNNKKLPFLSQKVPMSTLTCFGLISNPKSFTHLIIE